MPFPPETVYEAMGTFSSHYPDHPVVDRVLGQALGGILSHLPLMYWAEERGQQYNGPTIPLYDALDNCGEAITDGCLPILYDKELVQNGLLSEVRKQLFENEAHMNGLTLYGRRSKAVPAPQERDEPPHELCFLYFNDTPFLEFFNTQVPFQVPRKTFASHGVILAPPNHGKTQLLGSLIANCLNDTDPVGCFVLDPHGDLFETLQSRVQRDRLICLNPDESPPPLNFLDFGTSTEAQTLQTFSYLMSSLSGGLSDKQGAIVPYLLKLLKQIPNPSLETFRQIIDETPKSAQHSKFASYIELLPEVDQSFFRSQFYTPRMRETLQAIGWRLYSALSSDAFRQMFSANTNSFSADDAMRERKVVLVKGSRNALGDEGMRVFLQFIVAQFFSAALRREKLRPEQRHLCILFVDEAHHVFNNQTANILTECRKYGLGFMAATQVVQQIPEDVKAAIYGATAIKIAGPVSHNDAMILAREMYATGDFIRGMKAVERSHADFAFYVSGMTDRAVRVRVPYGRLESMPETHGATPIAPTPPTPTEGTPPTQPPAIPAPALPEQQHVAAPDSVAPPSHAVTAEPPQPVEANPGQPRPAAADPAMPPVPQPVPDDWRS